MGKRKKRRNPAKGMLLIASLLFIGFIGIFLYNRQAGETVQNEPVKQTVHSQPAAGSVEAGVTSEAPSDYHYPVAVMIDNAPAARPQSGLSKADIVYEALAEGGIPRYMPIYLTADDSVEVGPIRSVRPYFIDIAEGYRAILVHCGGSSEALAILSGDVKLFNLDEMKNSSMFFRMSGRQAPHNLYSTLGKLRIRSEAPAEVIAKVPKSIEEGTQDGKTITITYNRGYRVTWKWDAVDKVYRRYVMDEKDIDKSTSEQLTASAIIIQNVSSKTVDDIGHLDVGVTGKGQGSYFYEGLRSEINWFKDNPDTLTKYIIDGTEYLPGRGTWIELVPQGSGITSR